MLKEDKIKYQSDMTTERDIQNQIDFARDKGIEIGLEQGREKNQRFIEVLKEKGVPEEIIADALNDLQE